MQLRPCEISSPPAKCIASQYHLLNDAIQLWHWDQSFELKITFHFFLSNLLYLYPILHQPWLTVLQKCLKNPGFLL